MLKISMDRNCVIDLEMGKRVTEPNPDIIMNRRNGRRCPPRGSRHFSPRRRGN